ncbi:aminopeptidase N [Sphingomonas ursincola]|uniref:aminopeptidase N n=1 Tax=Sphingomonas ursincola TaxID=56361 RepID=UPI0023568960|nr:aminopeptidase N [Sphingomonas ursincola]MBY0621425.1 aminopeptidase N [Sphingomonas ursincola]
MADIQTATASPAVHEPPVIYRADYQPTDWRVETVSLEFDLDLSATEVHATLGIVRNGDHDRAVRLDCDGALPQTLAVDGQPVNWRQEGSRIAFDVQGERAIVTLSTRIAPDTNTQLMGLFASNGMLCTQCEAEGFRRIIPFVDRPDNMSVYEVLLRADKRRFPVLLSNGALVESGDLDGGRHYARWRDPHPKPSYLFALVAGDLVATRDSFTTKSGTHVDLAIFVRQGDEGRTAHAMQALKASMAWDERVYGLEYDLPVFNIVAVSDFNMGAMENKGLNIFNSRYILADPDTATDYDYDAIEGVVAHEYFHNWSGNRVTCRDWFQLSLKEGFTVYRDQCFSADMGSEAVKRIEDVRMLRAAQFPEDAGPLAHPIRPDSYMEISNFYTSTVYNKGAEVIRMMATMAGPERFRAGCDLYFQRHDGEAATCEDFVRAMEEGAALNLTQFRRWYEQAGTPQVQARLEHDAATRTATLHLRQNFAPTPGQAEKPLMPIPLRTALIDRDMKAHRGEMLVVLTEAEQALSFTGYARAPVLSINRGFSAPVNLDVARASGDLPFLVRHDDDPFARYEALQQLVIDRLIADIADMDGPGAAQGHAVSLDEIIAVFGDLVSDQRLDDSMRAEILSMPTEAFLGEQMLIVRPEAIHAARRALRKAIGSRLLDQWRIVHERASSVPYSLSREARGARKIKSLALGYIASAEASDAAGIAFDQFARADNMTDRQGALSVLASMQADERETALDSFYNRYQGNALVIDKWFSLQTGSAHPRVHEQMLELIRHKDFTLTNPNRVRALYWPFVSNQAVFHEASGRGYELLTDLVLKLDPLNPQTTARFIAPLGRWRRFDEARAAKMRDCLERILAQPGLSKDVTEQVVKSLE